MAAKSKTKKKRPVKTSTAIGLNPGTSSLANMLRGAHLRREAKAHSASTSTRGKPSK